MNCEEDVKKEVVCESCGGKEVKYRCPSCMRRTCSLQCVKYHKKDFSCSGVRCKTTYVSKTDYNYNNMINDYRFLEDTDRVAYSASSSQKHKQRHLNNSAKTLLRKSRQSGVILKLMPIGMSKRMTNTSYYNNRSKCIMWKVKWLFPQADSEYVNKRVSENEVLIELLETYIDPVQSNPVIRQRLKPYLQTSLDKISVFLKMEYQPANQERYHLLNPSQTLKECLSGKTIIEFPTLHVVLPDKSDMYKVQDTPTRPVPSQHSILDTQPLPETEEMRVTIQTTQIRPGPSQQSILDTQPLPETEEMRVTIQTTQTRPGPSQHSILDTQALPETEEMRDTIQTTQTRPGPSQHSILDTQSIAESE